MENNSNQNNTQNTNSSNFTIKNQSSNNSFKKPTQKSKSTSTSFGKSVLLPFVSGVLGATLVVGVCFNVPNLKKSLFNSHSSSSSSSSATIDYNTINTDMVSLSSFSDTGVAVAQKILPSVVGINVQYSVSTILLLKPLVQVLLLVKMDIF